LGGKVPSCKTFVGLNRLNIPKTIYVQLVIKDVRAINNIIISFISFGCFSKDGYFHDKRNSKLKLHVAPSMIWP
jgi:hypothetical protein